MLKFIDDKGRLFEKINIIDLLVILFFIALTPMVYFGYKIFNRPIPVIESINPSEIQKGDNKNILIKGKFMNKAVEAKFGDRVVKDIIIKGPALIEVAIPNDMSAGTYDVVVAIPGYGNAYYKNGLKINTMSELELYVYFSELDQESIKKISVGDFEKDINGNIIFELLEILKTEDDFQKINIGGNNIVKAPVLNKMRVLAKVKLKGDIKDKNFSFKGNSISIGSVLNFTTDKYSLKGEIFSLPYTKYLIKARAETLRSDKALLLHKGDTHIDKDGNIIGVINSEPEITQSKQVGLLQTDRMFKLIEYPFYNDVILDLEVNLVEKDNSYFYEENQRIYVGNQITFNTDKYSINGTVVSMKKIK